MHELAGSISGRLRAEVARPRARCWSSQVGTEGLLTRPRGESRANGCAMASVRVATPGRGDWPAERSAGSGTTRDVLDRGAAPPKPGNGSRDPGRAGAAEPLEMARRCSTGDRGRQRLGGARKALPAQRRGESAVVGLGSALPDRPRIDSSPPLFTKAGSSQHLRRQQRVESSANCAARRGIPRLRRWYRDRSPGPGRGVGEYAPQRGARGAHHRQ